MYIHLSQRLFNYIYLLLKLYFCFIFLLLIPILGGKTLFPWDRSKFNYTSNIRHSQYTIFGYLMKLINLFLKVKIIPIFNFIKAWDYNNFHTNFIKSTPIYESSGGHLYMNFFKIAVFDPDAVFNTLFTPIVERCLNNSLTLFTTKYNFMLLQHVPHNKSFDVNDDPSWSIVYRLMNFTNKKILK